MGFLMSDQFPYPADTRAKGWRFEIDHERIRQSDTWALASPEVRPWLLMLWMVAWEQTPCGSLPADESLIAARIGMAPKIFAKHRDLLLRGWKPIGGRLFHPVLTERVQEMLSQREKRAKRVADYRARKDSNGNVTRYTPVTDLLVTADVTGPQPVSNPTVMTPEPEPEPGKSLKPCTEADASVPPRERLVPEKPKTPLSNSGTARARVAKSEPSPASLAWRAYEAAYRSRYGVGPVRNAKVNGQFAHLVARLGGAEAPQVASWYVCHNGQLYVRGKHPVDLLLRDCEGLRTEWARGQQVTDQDARHVDRKQSTINTFAPLIAEAEAREAEERKNAV